MRPILIVAILSLSVGRAVAQTSAKGVPMPANIRPIALSDSGLISLYNGVEVLGEKFVGNPRAQVRVIGSWGGSAGLDCDCILTQVHIAVNLDGDEFRVYRLPELLDPKVTSIVTEKKNGVVYVEYGLTRARQRARVEILPTTIRVTEAARR